MIKLDNGLLRAVMRKLDYPEPEVGRLHLVGIRGGQIEDTICVKSGGGNDPNAYNDVIATFGQQVHLFKASVDPGTKYTTHPLHPEGCAHLANGAWLYKWGNHKGHVALVEAAPVKIWRDRNGDQHYQPGEVEQFSENLGIHIHAAGTAPQVDAWSAGCQVVYGGWTGQPWETLLAILRASKQARFRYYLVDIADLNL